MAERNCDGFRKYGMNVVQFFLRCISLVEEHKMSLHDYVHIFIYIAIAPSYLLAKVLLEV